MAIPQERRRIIEQPQIPMGEMAVQYGMRGWPSFPVMGKVPIKDFHWRTESTTNPAKLRELWSLHPTANIAVVTGSPSGLIVLDIDPRNGADKSLQALEKKYGKLPATRLSRTAHHGLHRYYAHPQDGETYGNAIQLDGLPGLDVRGEGGFIVAPPSRLGNLSYHWVSESFPIAPSPKWLLDLIKRPTNHDLPQQRVFTSSTGERWLQEGKLRAILGNRNATLFWVLQQCRDDGLSLAESRSIALSFVGQVPQGNEPFTEREALATLASVYRRPPRQPARRK